MEGRSEGAQQQALVKRGRRAARDLQGVWTHCRVPRYGWSPPPLPPQIPSSLLPKCPVQHPKEAPAGRCQFHSTTNPTTSPLFRSSRHRSCHLSAGNFNSATATTETQGRTTRHNTTRRQTYLHPSALLLPPCRPPGAVTLKLPLSCCCLASPLFGGFSFFFFPNSNSIQSPSCPFSPVGDGTTARFTHPHTFSIACPIVHDDLERLAAQPVPSRKSIGLISRLPSSSCFRELTNSRPTIEQPEGTLKRFVRPKTSYSRQQQNIASFPCPSTSLRPSNLYIPSWSSEAIAQNDPRVPWARRQWA